MSPSPAVGLFALAAVFERNKRHALIGLLRPQSRRVDKVMGDGGIALEDSFPSPRLARW